MGVEGEIPPETPDAPAITAKVEQGGILVAYSMAEDPPAFALRFTASAASMRDTGTEKLIRGEPPAHGQVVLGIPPGSGTYSVAAASYSEHASSLGPVIVDIASSPLGC